jgi:hypothetical protein
MKTRWNSKYYTLERLKEQHKAINVYIAENNCDIQGLTTSEFTFAEQLIKLLGQLEMAIVELSDEELLFYSN